MNATTEPWHGTVSGYRHHHCRCYPCSLANSEYSLEYYKKHYSSARLNDVELSERLSPEARQRRSEEDDHKRWFVGSGEPLRRLLLIKIQEIGISNVAAACGVSQRRIFEFAKNPPKQVTERVADSWCAALGESLGSWYPE